MTIPTVIYWATALLALVGVVLNIYKLRACFVIWAVTNATWAVVDYVHGIYAQAALQAVYFGLSIFGFYRWRAGAKPTAGSRASTPSRR